MKAKRSLALTASIAMLALTLTACEEKKKQDGTTTTATEPATEAATETTSESQTAEQAEAAKPAEQPSGNTFTDTRDNKTYKTVKIGTQVWMAENLKYEAKGSKCGGTNIQTGESEDDTFTYSNLEDKNTANCDKYGRLYNWETATKACPAGWHLPSGEEWQTLVNFAGGDETAGKILKAKSGWDNNGNGTDDFGFSAFPGGNCGFNCESDFDYSSCTIGRFEDIGYRSYWWTASEEEGDAV